MSQSPDLPPGCKWQTLEQICTVVLGQSPPSSSYNDQGLGLPFYQGKAEFGALHPTPTRWCTQPIRVAQAGDVLISVRAPVGPTNLCQAESCIGRGLAALRPGPGLSGRYLLYYLRCVEPGWAARATGTTFAAISGRVLKSTLVPLAPLPEQRRIVAAIEGRFARLEAGLAALERARAGLADYQQAVLQAHYAGDWARATLGQVIQRIEAGRSPRAQNRPARRGEFGVLKVGAVGWGRFMAHENKALLPGHEPGDTPTVRAGDLLVARANARQRVGAVALVEQDYPHLMLSDKTLRLVPDLAQVLPRYLCYALKTRAARDFFASRASGTNAGMCNISQKKLRAAPVPLPPLDEQGRIVERVQRAFGAVLVLEETLDYSLARAEQLRQAILERAFSGGSRELGSSCHDRKLITEDENFD
jgi:type I restriction enzyme S subunit